ncbi:hypothetical protein LI328DRAFT_169026 [Trichoderma asperelloides]|nr:hypothetical protein LI328DRAFT_169026 [Trichoderma asperelloides]
MDVTASRITARALQLQLQSQRLARLSHSRSCLCVVPPQLQLHSRPRSSLSRHSPSSSHNYALSGRPCSSISSTGSSAASSISSVSSSKPSFPSPSPSRSFSFSSSSHLNAKTQSSKSLKTTTATMSQNQAVQASLTKSATFLVLTINSSSPSAVKTVRSVLASVSDLAKNVVLRDLNSQFSCAVGIGSDAWDALTAGTGLGRPAELHPFRQISGAKHTAVSTPGDLLFHIRADRRDICFEFERQLLAKLGDAAAVVDDTQGFRYFDARDLLGFVDGTANPVGPAVPDAVLIAGEDAACAGGSYVVVQKYVHDVKAWGGLSTEAQEAIIGRTKLDNMELDDQPDGHQQAHKTLATIEDDDGNEYSILRDNMPFGSPGSGVFGTYFIGYSRRLWVIEKMLERMFVGHPPGKHDRILDFSTALTGTTFYAPPPSVLESLGSD